MKKLLSFIPKDVEFKIDYAALDRARISTAANSPVQVSWNSFPKARLYQFGLL
jgi:hypothetical protein